MDESPEDEYTAALRAWIAARTEDDLAAARERLDAARARRIGVVARES